MKILIFLLTLAPNIVFSKCDVYYFSLDFGGAIGNGDQIVDYLGKNDVPFTLFLVGKNSVTENGKKVCEKIRNSKNRKISIGNHTVSHEGFNPNHSEEHIRSEILGNESYMNACDAKRVIKYFRYPKGSANPLAEKVLKEAGYLGTYEKFFPQSDAVPTKAVWWTTDTRDWVRPTGASAWAQTQYYNRTGKILPVDEASWRDLIATLKEDGAGKSFNSKIKNYLLENGSEYPQFNSIENVPGLHGPTVQEIVENVLKDSGKKGRDGKNHCFPLMHYGGTNTYAAFERIIPILKASGASFRGLGDGDTVNYQLEDALKDFNNLNYEVAANCANNKQFNYVVQTGDTLFSIARNMINTNRTTCPEYEKSPVSTLVRKILSLNNLTESSEIVPEQVLNIPKTCE